MARTESTPYAILGLLSIQPMSGYDMRKELQQSLLYFWKESNGQIYPTLKRLTAQGLVARVHARGKNRRERQMHTLTAEGRRRLREWLAQPPGAQPVRSEFLMKLFLGHSAPAGACLEHIRRYRTEQKELLETFLIFRDSVRKEHASSPHLKYWAALIEHGIRIRRAEIEWCNLALRMLAATAKSNKS
jgi:PadR family transcriptional regulator, regulatory protein AphA